QQASWRSFRGPLGIPTQSKSLPPDSWPFARADGPSRTTSPTSKCWLQTRGTTWSLPPTARASTRRGNRTTSSSSSWSADSAAKLQA
ncbi:unnamed protein product, partial [Mycena citricolor]